MQISGDLRNAPCCGFFFAYCVVLTPPVPPPPARDVPLQGMYQKGRTPQEEGGFTPPPPPRPTFPPPRPRKPGADDLNSRCEEPRASSPSSWPRSVAKRASSAYSLAGGMRGGGGGQGGGEGSTNVHAPYLGASLQHPSLLPQATPRGATQPGATELGATHYGCRRATGQPGAEKRGGGGGGEEEARIGNPCARNPVRAVSQVPAVHRQWGRHHQAT